MPQTIFLPQKELIEHSEKDVQIWAGEKRVREFGLNSTLCVQKSQNSQGFCECNWAQWKYLFKNSDSPKAKATGEHFRAVSSNLWRPGFLPFSAESAWGEGRVLGRQYLMPEAGNACEGRAKQCHHGDLSLIP